MKSYLNSISVFLMILFCSAALSAQDRPVTVLVQPFVNTGSAEFSWIAAGMTDTVISDLARIKSIQVISDSDRVRVLKELELAQTGMLDEAAAQSVGKLLGADLIFTGSYLAAGGNIRVNARIIRVTSGKIEAVVKSDGTISDIFALQDSIVIKLSSEASGLTIEGRSPFRITDADKTVIAQRPKPDISAYQLYAKGLELKPKDPAGALGLFKKALDIEPAYDDALMQAGYVSGAVLNRFDDGIRYLEQAEKIFTARKDTAGMKYAELLNSLGLVYAGKGDIQKARSLYQRAGTVLDAAGKGSSRQAAVIYNNTGITWWNAGDGDKAAENYLKAKNIYEKLSLEKSTDYGDCINNIGIIYLGKGRFDDALDCFMKDKAIEDALGLSGTRGYASVMNNIGLVHWNKKDYSRALEFFNADKRIKEKLGLAKTSEYAALEMNIGNVYNRQNDAERALEHYLSSKEIREELGLSQSPGYAALMSNIGVLYFSQGNNEKAFEYYLKDKDIKEALKLTSTTGYAQVLYNLGLLYERKNLRKLAGEHFRKSFDVYEKAGYSGDAKNKALEAARQLGY